MNNLIRKIFLELEFKLDERLFANEKRKLDADIFFAERTYESKFDYFLVVLVKENVIYDDLLRLTFDECLEIILKEYQVNGIDKNLSLLLLLETKDLNFSKELNSVIYDLEEDPYDFKKYVLTYSSSQVGLLIDELCSLNINVIHSLKSILQNKEYFSSFKQQENITEESEKRDSLIYDVVSKFFIKLPFLTVEINQQTLTNLNNEIKSSISDDDLPLVDSVIDLYTQNPDPDIDEILSLVGVENDE